MTTTRRRANPEKRIETACIRALRSLGFFVDENSQPQRARGCTPGKPDLFVVHERWRLAAFIEVKAPKGRLSTAQRVWHRNVNAVVPVLVVRSVDELLHDLRALGAPIE